MALISWVLGLGCEPSIGAVCHGLQVHCRHDLTWGGYYCSHFLDEEPEA